MRERRSAFQHKERPKRIDFNFKLSFAFVCRCHPPGVLAVRCPGTSQFALAALTT